MSSSQPVATPNALNFTPDNKHAYAYSGGISVDNNYIEILSIQSNSEYIDAKFQPALFDAVTDDYEFRVKFNGVHILSTFTDSYKAYAPYQEIELIIPPFTTVTIEANNRQGSGANTVGALITGKVFGMAEVGYQ